MEMKSLLFVIIIASILISCGPNKEEQAAIEKAKIDSVSTAIKKAIEDSINISMKLGELLEQRKFTKDAIEYLDASIYQLKENQNQAEIELENIKSFQFGRTSTEKESQIAIQVSRKRNIDERLISLSGAQKIFKKIYNLTKDLDKRKFNSIGEFEIYQSELNSQIQNIESDVLSDIDNESLAKFNYETIITDKNFKKEVERFKEGHFAMTIDTVASN